MSLRARLLLGVVALVAAGLLVANVVTFTLLRSFLYERVDQQLVASRFAVARALEFGGPGEFRGRPIPGSSLPVGTFGQVRDERGNILTHVTLGEARLSPPELPEALPGSGISPERSIFTARPVRKHGPGAYRVLAEPLRGGGTLVIAIPLHEIGRTLRRLIVIEAVVAVAVVAGVALLGLSAVRLGLRPLREIEATASEIAQGDLTRRVDRADERTEVGRLGVALNSMLAQIEQAFAERTASEDRLRRFLADASHELRTPLTSIRGYAELFRRGADVRPDDLAKAMRRIEEESTRMGVLVNDLLLLARLDQGRPLERTPVDLVQVAADAVADARAIDHARTIGFGAGGPVVVEGDEASLRQVAGNLLSNALTHTPAGTPVEVRVSTDVSGAILEVADHGPGICASDAQRVFERFYRADPSRTRGSGGAGLGLSIVSALVEAHGGTVSVSETPGGGATFRVEIPLREPG